jgi:rhamnogalacturonyl hydrolase YesR
MSIALADTILARFPDPDTFPYRRWCYVQGYVLCGFEKLWRSTGDPRYFAYIKGFVDQHVSAEADIRDFTGDSLDDMMAGTTIVASTSRRVSRGIGGRLIRSVRRFTTTHATAMADSGTRAGCRTTCGSMACLWA